MYYLKTPQTTYGMEYPDNSIKITIEKIVEDIKKIIVILIALLWDVVYGGPLINILSRIFPNKNLVYIGSDCFKMFGVYSKGMPYNYYDDAIKENWIEVVEELPEGCKNHPNLENVGNRFKILYV